MFVTIAPVFALILLGYFAVRLGVLQRGQEKVLGAFVLNFALPALVFDALATRDLASVVDWSYLLPYATGSLGAMALVLMIALKFQGRPPTLAVFQAMGSGFSNTGLIGYPIALRVIGEPAGVVLALSVLAENVVLLPLTLVLAEAAAGGRARLATVAVRAVVRVARMPIVVAILAGALFAALDAAPPRLVTDLAGLLAGAAAPMALMAVGGSLVAVNLASRRSDILKVALFKLLLHPFAVALAVWGMPMERSQLSAVAVLLAGMPMLSIYPVLAGRHGHGEVSAATLALTTMLSFATVPTLLWALTWFGWLPPPSTG